jgi:hypothetical protein
MDWTCEVCGGKSFARVDEKKSDGNFGPGPDVRCIECKTVSRAPTLPNADELEVVAGKWLLMKRGLYWRPNSQGYTGLKSEAGRYTDEEVAIYRRQDEREVFILDAETADEIAPKCWPDVAQRHLAGLLSSAQAQIASARSHALKQHGRAQVYMNAAVGWQRRAEAAEAEVKRLREALEPFAALGEEASWMTKPDDAGAWGFDGVSLTWGDFRRARTTLSGGTSNG